jgi:hypothetical protein
MKEKTDRTPKGAGRDRVNHPSRRNFVKTAFTAGGYRGDRPTRTYVRYRNFSTEILLQR